MALMRVQDLVEVTEQLMALDLVPVMVQKMVLRKDMLMA